jgi:hypothetical protein
MNQIDVLPLVSRDSRSVMPTRSKGGNQPRLKCRSVQNTESFGPKSADSENSLRRDGVDFRGLRLVLAGLALQLALQAGEVEIDHRGRIQRQDLAESQSAHH